MKKKLSIARNDICTCFVCRFETRRFGGREIPRRVLLRKECKKLFLIFFGSKTINAIGDEGRDDGEARGRGGVTRSGEVLLFVGGIIPPLSAPPLPLIQFRSCVFFASWPANGKTKMLLHFVKFNCLLGCLQNGELKQMGNAWIYCCCVATFCYPKRRGNNRCRSHSITVHFRVKTCLFSEDSWDLFYKLFPPSLSAGMYSNM